MHFKKIIFQQCVQRSYYRPWAEDKIDELLEISEHNALLRETFKKLLKYSDLQLKHDQLMSDEFKDERATLEHYIEFMYYTSDEFIQGMNNEKREI